MSADKDLREAHDLWRYSGWRYGGINLCGHAELVTDKRKCLAVNLKRRHGIHKKG
jgi:hypothetical protein